MPPPFAPQAPLATLHGGQLVCLASAAPGGARWDVARCIDLLQARESVSFLTKMRPEVASAARDLEAWVARQQHGLGLAAHADSLQQSAETLLKASVLLGGNYCSRLTKLGLCAATAAAEQHHLLRCLLNSTICCAAWHQGLSITMSCGCSRRCLHSFKPCSCLAAAACTAPLPLQVMDSLYQIRSRRRETDQLFDQLKEACGLLAGEHRVKEAARTDKQLDDIRTRWEALKKAAPQVCGSAGRAREAANGRK